jgi:hypothetical protein
MQLLQALQHRQDAVFAGERQVREAAQLLQGRIQLLQVPLLAEAADGHAGQPHGLRAGSDEQAGQL